MTKRHILLIGLSGSGKSTVGKAVANELATHVSDIDESIAAREGTTIADIFATRGEPSFRALERHLVSQQLDTAPHVVIPGGGWAAQPGNLESVSGKAFLIYLETSPAVAANRLGSGHGRPLLSGRAAGDLARLLSEREAFYRRAPASVATDALTLDQVVDQVVALARESAGW